MQVLKNYFPVFLVVLLLSCKNKAGNQHNLIKKADTTVQNNAVIKKDTLLTAVKSSVIDTATVLAAFRNTVKTPQFRKELEIAKDDSDGSVFDSERPVLIGDINGDQLADAIMPFSIEGRGGGNNWDAHYAIFINKEGKLEYKSSFSRGGDLAERQVQFMSIQDNVIKGAEVPGFKFPEGDSVAVSYIYKKGGLVEKK